MRRLLMGVVLSCVVLGSGAADNNGTSQFWGTRTCGKYLSDVQQGNVESLFDAGWVAGFITAYNIMAPDTYDIIGNSDMQSVTLFIRNYCKANSLKNVDDAMQPLIEQLLPKRHRSQKEAGR